MNINRHNYEEFFVLYMDNELSSEDSRMVEAFVQNHPDLKEELELLIQYKLIPDESIVFENKEILLKVNTIINSDNYEEWLLLYIDNELTIDQKKAVDKFLSNNLSVKKEFEILQKSKLQPEKIVFANKESLYRKEEKVRRLPVRWWRAAAAVLIFAIGLTTFLLLNNKKAAVEDPIVKTPGTEQSNPVVNLNEQLPKENIVADVNKKEETITGIPEQKNNSYQIKAPVSNQENKNMVTNKAVQSPVIKLPVNNFPVQRKKEESELIANNNLPKPITNPNIINNDAANNAIANVNLPKEIKKMDALTNPVVTPENTQPSDYTNASFIEEESQQDGKKNKLRGFFRKITRTFEKRTNIDATNDDGKLLVAGLAIKLN